ncbi:uncharacterized protein TNCV_422131 [Trichonephila clavipes]|nr:uncharacterized protein TNCV_422131 [Trichonephila clavipes]
MTIDMSLSQRRNREYQYHPRWQSQVLGPKIDLTKDTYFASIRTSVGHNPNIEWHCQCKVAAAVVGCRAHVVSVLWYLGYWRHNYTQTNTPSLRYANTLQDAATGWSSDDLASESEKEI